MTPHDQSARELAKLINNDFNGIDMIDHGDDAKIGSGGIALITQALRAANDAGVKEGLEKAAVICEEGSGRDGYSILNVRAHKIRALIKS